jgi:hypothetical protein
VFFPHLETAGRGWGKKFATLVNIKASVAEPHHFYAAPGKNFDAAPAPTLLYSKAKFLKRTKV